MARRWTHWLCLLWLTAIALPAEAQTRYRLSFPEAAQHYVQVEARYVTGGEARLVLFLPVWTPGYYKVQNFSQWVDRLTAIGEDGQPLLVQTLSKNRWSIGCAGRSEVTLNYRVKGPSLRVVANFVDANRAVLQGAATFISPLKPAQPTFEVRVERPAGWKSTQTSLPPAPDGGEGHFRATSFDQLVDCPLVSGSPSTQEFRAGGVRHVLVNLGDSPKWDGALAVRDLQTVVEEIRRFWGFYPFGQNPPDSYRFLNLVGTNGGLEHKSSTCIGCPSGFQGDRQSYRRWLHTAAHEYFHAWNVKQLRPVALGPFDYEAEDLTPSLWIAEGLTTYYTDLLLARSGLVSANEYLVKLSALIPRTQEATHRIGVSLVEASMNAWFPSRKPGLYGGGQAVGFLLDQRIRQATGDRSSLDDVMREAYRLYSGEHGYTEENFEAVASKIAGIDLDDFFGRYVRDTEILDFAPALRYYGLRFQPADSRTPHKTEWRQIQVDPAASPEARSHWKTYFEGSDSPRRGALNR